MSGHAELQVTTNYSFLRDGTALLLYPTDRPAWSRLCRLLTLALAEQLEGYWQAT